LASKTTVTLPAGTVLKTTKSVTVQGHTIQAETTVTLGEEVSVDVGTEPGNELPGGGGGGGAGNRPSNELPGQQPGSRPGVDNTLPPTGQPKK
jgi:hypothetical protein